MRPDRSHRTRARRAIGAGVDRSLPIEGGYEGRPPSDADLPDLIGLFTDARVSETLGGPRAFEQVRQVLADWRRSWAESGFGPWIVRRDSGPGQGFAGYAGLAPARAGLPGEIELLYAFLPECWGAGLATRSSKAVIDDAFCRVELRELIAYTLTTNAPSRRVIEKLGFRFERLGEHAGLPHAFYRLALEVDRT